MVIYCCHLYKSYICNTIKCNPCILGYGQTLRAWLASDCKLWWDSTNSKQRDACQRTERFKVCLVRTQASTTSQQQSEVLRYSVHHRVIGFYVFSHELKHWTKWNFDLLLWEMQISLPMVVYGMCPTPYLLLYTLNGTLPYFPLSFFLQWWDLTQQPVS